MSQACRLACRTPMRGPVPTVAGAALGQDAHYALS